MTILSCLTPAEKDSSCLAQCLGSSHCGAALVGRKLHKLRGNDDSLVNIQAASINPNDQCDTMAISVGPPDLRTACVMLTSPIVEVV